MCPEPHINRTPHKRRTTVFIGMGANLGQRREMFRQALAWMNQIQQTAIGELSPLYYSDPVEGAGPGEFLNGVARLSTGLDPQDFMERLQEIEKSLGRTDKGQSRPRTIDLDILLFGSRIVRRKNLVVPHPKMSERGFVLAPFCELAPDTEGPPENRTIADYWERLDNKGGMRPAHDLAPEQLLRSAPVQEG